MAGKTEGGDQTEGQWALRCQQVELRPSVGDGSGEWWRLGPEEPEGVEVGFLGCEASVLSVSQAAGVGAQRQGRRQEGHRPGLDSGSQD